MNIQPNRNNQNNQSRPNPQLRPLTEEEKRRIRAARQAAQQNPAAQNRQPSAQTRTMTEAERAAAIRRQQAVRAAANQPAAQQQSKSAYRKRRSNGINKGALVFALIILLVLVVSVVQISRNGKATAQKEPTYESVPLPEEPTVIPEETEPAESETEAEPVLLNVFETKTILNTTLDEGDQILVNTAHPYAKADTVSLVNVYGAPQAIAKVANTSVAMSESALDALERMNTAFIADTYCDDLMIVSGHRTMADQQRIYNDYLEQNGQDYVDSYVALPGASEHHTGLACDLTFFTDDGYSVPLAEHENGGWFGENCTDYGFIRRYPADKVELTGFAYEAWHFRYVGIPHAYACEAKSYCYEEYIDALRGYTTEDKILYVQKNGMVSDVPVTEPLPTTDGWLIYYVPMAEGESTDVPMLTGDAYANAAISGNNADGFIVTVSLAD